VFGLRGLPAQHRDPAGQHGQRRIVLNGGVTDRGEPTLDGRHLPHLVGRQGQLGHQLDAPVPFGGVQQVLDGHRRGTVGLIPVRGPQVQFLEDLGFDAAQLTEQELAKQRVVAIPLAPPIERDHE
jgi:hypothetical protein